MLQLAALNIVGGNLGLAVWATETRLQPGAQTGPMKAVVTQRLNHRTRFDRAVIALRAIRQVQFVRPVKRRQADLAKVFHLAPVT